MLLTGAEPSLGADSPWSLRDALQPRPSAGRRVQISPQRVRSPNNILSCPAGAPSVGAEGLSASSAPAGSRGRGWQAPPHLSCIPCLHLS